MDGIRSLTIDDVPQAKMLSDAEGWNQTDKDWKLLVTASGNVCLAYKSGDKIIATATAMNYSNELAWLGMVLVHREHRGNGISKCLVAALLDKLKYYKSVKLDATPAGQPVYEKFGFEKEGVVYRMTSDAIDPDLVPPESYFSAQQVVVSNISEIIKYDLQATGVNRKVLIEYLFNEFPRTAFLIRKEGIIKGFALGREGARYYQIGPLVAETDENAKELLTSYFNIHSGKSVVVDVFEDKKEIFQWLRKAGFKIQRQFMRMRLSNETLFSMNEKYFLIAGPEFG